MKRKRPMFVPRIVLPVAMECGCINEYDGGITFCPLHEAAPQMLQTLAQVWALLDRGYQPGSAMIEDMRDLIAKAEEK